MENYEYKKYTHSIFNKVTQYTETKKNATKKRTKYESHCVKNNIIL